MKKLRILNIVLKRTNAYQILGIFILFVLIVSLILQIIEPGINNYGDALWYCYVNLFTIGFGDIVPVTVAGRILSVLLTVYATIVIAVVTGVVVAFYNEIVNRKIEHSREVILDRLERLPELSKEELQEIADQVKTIR